MDAKDQHKWNLVIWDLACSKMFWLVELRYLKFGDLDW